MVWFSEDILQSSEIYYNFLERLKQEDFNQLNRQQHELDSIKVQCVEIIQEHFYNEYSIVTQAFNLSQNFEHVMQITRIRFLESFFSLIRKIILNIKEKQEMRQDIPMSSNIIQKIMLNWLILALNWSFAGDLKLHLRYEFWSQLQNNLNGIEFP